MERENRIFLTPTQELQPVVKYEELERSPVMVAKQTYTLLSLFHKGAIHKPELAKDYLSDYTINYLKQAEKELDVIYDKKGILFKDIGLEAREVACHAFIVFANLPDNLNSPFLPNGFSRRGMLKAPKTKDEFLERIKELKIGLWYVVEGEMKPRTTLEAYPHLLRTFGFFKVGSELPIKLSEGEREKEQEEKEKFNDLLKDIEISF